MDFTTLNTAVASAFAETVTITPAEGSDPEAVETRGIFDSRHYEVEDGGGVGVSTLITTLAVDETETGAVGVGATVVARGVTYTVKDKRPDGQGMTVLDLEKGA
jgi:hypothetical protein